MKNRIAEIIEKENLTSARFANQIGIQPSAVSHILSGRNNPSLDVAQKILNTYRTINPDWLILGVGTMYREVNKNFEKQVVESINPQFKPQMPSLFPEDPVIHTEYVKENGINSTERNVPTDVQPEKHVSGTLSNEKHQNNELKQNTELITPIPMQQKKIRNVIIYYTDNTFEELKP
jgi:transcriptional regulator with XRE-family HTH domain